MMKNNCENISDLDRKTGQIMEINVNSTSAASVLTRVGDFISHSKRFYIVTPNPELVLMAQKDKNLKDALNDADISVPDGGGLKIANPAIKIIKGRELFLELINLAAKNNWKVFLLGGLNNEAALAAKRLESLYPGVKISSSAGPMLDKEARPLSDRDVKIERDVKNRIQAFAPELLFVAFGNPRQEIWVHDNLSKLKVGGAMCVGGTLRYIAGLSKLPPKWMSAIGFEWLHRLITEPKRFGRVFRAVVIFPIKYIIYTCSKTS